MSPKFSNAPTAAPLGPLVSTGTALTHEGGQGFDKDARTELFTLAVTNMVGETTFYESAANRDNRFRDLVRHLAVEDPEWTGRFIEWLRSSANMRSASTVAAVEFAIAAKGEAWARDGFRALQRPDEPAEALGYFLATYGRKMPMAVKRGIAEAAVRLYTERAAIKYDGGSRGVRMGDVIELTHPTPKAEWQSVLFKHLLDRRHGHFNYLEDGITDSLPMLGQTYALDATPAESRRAVLRERGPEVLADGGYTWERLAGWLPGGMDAEAWEAIIPNMGYMALLRNLRNFEKVGVSDTVLDAVAARIADPAEVAKSRQLPFRFWSAYKNAGDRFTYPIAKALEASVENVPSFSGRTLVMVDTSSSMRRPISEKSTVEAVEVAALFGAAVSARSKVDLCIYGNVAGRLSGLPPSVLRTTEAVRGSVGQVGHGTNTWPSTMQVYDGHDRIIVFSDMQDHRDYQNTQLPHVPIYVWDLMGYAKSNIDVLNRGWYLFAGFSDACFSMIPLLEAGREAHWPWL